MGRWLELSAIYCVQSGLCQVWPKKFEPKIISTSKSRHHADRARKNYVGEQAVPKFNVQESNQINTLFQICCFQNVVNCSNYLQTRHNLNEIKDLDMQTLAMKKKIQQMLLNGPHSDFSGTLVILPNLMVILKHSIQVWFSNKYGMDRYHTLIKVVLPL